jgi:hypothetical protein
MSSDIKAVTYEQAFAVTQSDTVADPSGPFAGLFTAAGGTIKITTINGQTVTLNSVAAGIILPIAIQRVWSTTTNVSNLIGLCSLPYKQTLNPGTGDISKMGQLADRIADLADVPARASKAVTFEIEGFLQEEFDAGHDPYGSAWTPLAEATVAKGRHAPPLTDTGRMGASLEVRPLRGAGVGLSISHPGEDHQTGWDGPQGSGPARPIFPDKAELPETWRDAIDDAVDAEFRRAG